jgi:hypothetical protein
MRLKSQQLFGGVVLSAALAGGLAHPASAQAPPAKKPAAVPPALARECADRVAKDLPKIQIAGNFLLAQKHRGILDPPFDPRRDDTYVIGPSKNLTLLGSTFRGFAGCSYGMQDGKLEFKKLLHPASLPTRYKLMRGEE